MSEEKKITSEEALDAALEENDEALKRTRPVNLFPTSDELKKELDRERYKNRFVSVLRSTLFAMLIAVAGVVILAVIFMPVLQIVGSSMNPTMKDGDTVLALNISHYSRGDIIAFYYNNNILVKRVIAVGGDEVLVDEDGNVFVNDQPIEEAYLEEKALGECNIDMPYRVPEGLLFVMGDNRATSIDSRHTAIGCINSETVIGRILIRVWPIKEFRLFLR
ncbi:MAG: signal peptidase I [Firmicutes bacterium]|nr:signal peptidase I [Bacillota bacterium]